MPIKDLFKESPSIINNIVKTFNAEKFSDNLDAGTSVGTAFLKIFLDPILEKITEKNEEKFWKILKEIANKSLGEISIEAIKHVRSGDLPHLSSVAFSQSGKFGYSLLFPPIVWFKQLVLKLLENQDQQQISPFCKEYNRLIIEEFEKEEWQDFFKERDEKINSRNEALYLGNLADFKNRPLTEGEPPLKDIYIQEKAYMLSYEQWGDFKRTAESFFSEDPKEFIKNVFFAEKPLKDKPHYGEHKNISPLLYVSAHYGIGKTTFLKWFASEMAKEHLEGTEPYFPVYSELNPHYEMSKIERYLEREYGFSLDERRPYFFLLDSIDESGPPTEEHFNAIINEFEQLCKRFKNCRVVVTSRPVGGSAGKLALDIKNKNQKFLYLSGFEEEQVNEYIKKHRIIFPRIPGKLNYSYISSKMLSQQDDIAKPLFLSMVLKLFESGQITIDYLDGLKNALSKAELYMRFLNSLSPRVKMTLPETDEDYEKKIQYRYILRRLAAIRQIEDRKGKAIDGINWKEVREYLNRDSDKKIYDMIESEKYILVSHFGKKGDYIEFNHKSFREYLVAEYLLETFITAFLTKDKPRLCIGYVTEETVNFFEGLLNLFKMLFDGKKQQKENKNELFKQFVYSLYVGEENMEAYLDSEKHAFDNTEKIKEKLLQNARDWLEDETVYTRAREEDKKLLNTKLDTKNTLPSQEHIFCERWYALILLQTFQESIENIHLGNMLRESLHSSVFYRGMLKFLSNSNLKKVDLAGANLAGAVLTGANLKGTDLSRANLAGARLDKARLDGANLEGANLENIDLTGASVEGSNFSGANLQGAILKSDNLKKAYMVGAHPDGNVILYDMNTGLEWIAGPDKDTTWDEAKAWVDSLNSEKFSGGGWRMPGRDELRSLYKEGLGTRNMSPQLKTTGWWVWSGEVKDSSSAWLFFFSDGRDHCFTRSSTDLCRGFAVRSRIG